MPHYNHTIKYAIKIHFRDNKHQRLYRNKTNNVYG